MTTMWGFLSKTPMLGARLNNLSC